MTNRVQCYILQFTQIFNGRPWLDESFSKKLDQLSDKEAFTPSPGNNHSVAEVVCHLILWRTEVLRRLNDNSAERRITEASQDWKPVFELKQAGWQQLYAEFKQSQHTLINLLHSVDDDFLDRQLADTQWNNEYFVAGLLHHDVYHLGQIGLILKWT